MSEINNFSPTGALIGTILPTAFFCYVMTTKETKKNSFITKAAKAVLAGTFACTVLSKAADKMGRNSSAIIPIIGATVIAGKVLGQTKSFSGTVTAGLATPATFIAGAIATNAVTKDPVGFFEGIFSVLASLPQAISRVFVAQMEVINSALKRV